MAPEPLQHRLAGYAFLIKQYRLSARPNRHSSAVSPTGALRSTIQDDQGETIYKIKDSIGHVVDMPDRLIDLFIYLCPQNNGRLLATKSEAHFNFLTDDELASMEDAVENKYRRG